jgi:hypothetical protein
MRRKRLLLFIFLATLPVAFLAVLLAPAFVSSGLRLWLRWEARQQELTVDLDKIDARLFRPVTIRNLRLKEAKGSPLHIEIKAEHLVADLNLARILIGTRGRAIRSLAAEKLRVQISRNWLAAQVRKSQIGWSTLQKLLPGSFNLSNLELRVEDGPNIVLLRNSTLSASEIEAGRFSAGEIIIASPLLHQTFTNLRGSTKWQDNRLTLGGISLARGLDLESLTADFSHIGKERANVQFDLDTFGGKLRASFSNEWRHNHAAWDFAGAATDVSLEQTSEAMGFADPVGGLLHACKLTFRGDPRDLTHAAASIWIELGDPTWRGRTAEVIMMGAALYNQQIQLQQLYIKQRDNQLTMSGQGSLPSQSSDWLSPDFRGTISGSISDLGAFASLFGAAPDRFAGTLAIEGTVNARDRKIGGHVIASASSLSLFKTQVDSFITSLNLKGSDLEIEQFDLRRKEDWLHAEGRIDLASGHNYSGSLSADLRNVSDYLSLFQPSDSIDSNPASAHIQLVADSGVWKGNAIITTPSSRLDAGIISLPLGIGENWSQFSITPLNIILSFPVLSLDKGPRWLGLGVLRGGILSGGIRVFGTLEHPKLEGDVQLIDGEMTSKQFGFDRLSGRLRLAGTHGTIDFLQSSNKTVDLAFRGEMEIGDAEDIAIALTSTLPLFDASRYPLGCVSGVVLSPIDTILAPVVNQIELRGGLINRGWTISLRPIPRGMLEPPMLGERTLPLCLGPVGNGGTVVLGSYSPPQRVPPAHRKRTRKP